MYPEFTRHDLNQALVGALMWYVPLLIISFFLILGPILQKAHVRSVNVRNLVGACLLVTGGFILAGVAGLFTIGFGLCYGKNCSEELQAATGLIPALLSLVFTVPAAAILIKSKTQTTETRSSNKLLLVIGVVILVWSSLVYIPRIVSAVNEYRSSAKQSESGSF